MRQGMNNVQHILAAKNYDPKASIICLTWSSASLDTSATHDLNLSSWRYKKMEQCYRERHKNNMSRQESSLF